jgi:hypothetical protein
MDSAPSTASVLARTRAASDTDEEPTLVRPRWLRQQPGAGAITGSRVARRAFVRIDELVPSARS